MPATNVKSVWSGGDLYFYDKSGNEILHFDGTNRAVVVPSGSGIQAGASLATAVTADGAISIPSSAKTYFVTKSSAAAAMTIADPTATTHDGVRLIFISTTAQAHTLDNSAGSGFFSSGGSSKDVATFGGAIGDGMSIIAYQGKWYIEPNVSKNITLG